MRQLRVTITEYDEVETTEVKRRYGAYLVLEGVEDVVELTYSVNETIQDIWFGNENPTPTSLPRVKEASPYPHIHLKQGTLTGP